MKRRTLLQWMISAAAVLPFERIRLLAQPRELTPDDIRDFKAKFGYDPASIPICGGSYRHFGALDAVASCTLRECRKMRR